jgi:hypothetical protein
MIVRNAVSAVAACLTLLISGSQALASPIDSGLTYRVLNHPDGDIAPPVYALRLDGLDGSSDHNFTFDTESNGAFLTIAYDDAGAGTLTIAGTVYGGHAEADDYVSAQLWGISFSYIGVADLGDTLEVTTGSGSGSITALGDGGMAIGGFDIGEEIDLIDKKNMAGLSFRLNFGHRAPDDVLTATGWLMHDIPTHGTSQDWLFTVGAPVVPEPGTALLLAFGLAGLASQRRRRA